MQACAADALAWLGLVRNLSLQGMYIELELLWQFHQVK
jgi:hypothetical protein